MKRDLAIGFGCEPHVFSSELGADGFVAVEFAVDDAVHIAGDRNRPLKHVQRVRIILLSMKCAPSWSARRRLSAGSLSTRAPSRISTTPPRNPYAICSTALSESADGP